jgi:hypothetical protein
LDPPASSGRGLVVLSAADFPAPRRAPAGDAGPDARDAEDHAQAILDLVALGEALARACYDARPRGRATAQALRRALTRLLDEEVDTLWGVLKEIRTHARALAAQRARWEMVEAAAQAAQAALKQALAPDAGALEE